MRTAFLALLGSVAVVALGLILVVGVFWVLNLAPLLLFLGAAGVYVALSSRQAKPTSPDTSKSSDAK